MGLLMGVNIGALDRRIVIRTFTTTPDASGQEIKTPVTYATRWARRMDIAGAERFNANQTLAVRTARFRMRWLEGVTEEMQVIEAGNTWDILGIADDKRQDWMELSCKAVNPPAVAAIT